MEKYSYDWCKELMLSRGYEAYGSYQSNNWSKLIGNIDEDCFWIYARINTEKHEEGIQLSSNILKQLINLQTPYFQIDHPDFEGFEKQLIKYIDCCMQQDIIDDILYQRQQDRKNKIK